MGNYLAHTNFHSNTNYPTLCYQFWTADSYHGPSTYRWCRNWSPLTVLCLYPSWYTISSSCSKS